MPHRNQLLQQLIDGKSERQWDNFLRSFLRSYPACHHDDLMQEARVALWKAWQVYKPASAKFSTFAYPHITGALQHYMRDRAHTIRTAAWAHDKGVRTICQPFSSLSIFDARSGTSDDGSEISERLLATAPYSVENGAVLSLQLKDALMRLPEKQRAIVLWHDVEGRDFSEIARVYGIAPNTVTVHYKKAQARLQWLLSSEGVSTRCGSKF